MAFLLATTASEGAHNYGWRRRGTDVDVFTSVLGVNFAAINCYSTSARSGNPRTVLGVQHA